VLGQSEMGSVAATSLTSVYGVIVAVGNPMNQLAGLIEQRPISLLCLVRRDLEQGLFGVAFKMEPANLGTWQEEGMLPKLHVSANRSRRLSK